MNKFTTPVVMQVTQEQYNKDLKNSLLQMGYIEESFGDFEILPHLVNNLGQTLGKTSNVGIFDKDTHNRYFIDHYNPKLFLALAAMTNEKEGIEGEYWKFIRPTMLNFIQNNIYKANRSIDYFMAFREGGWQGKNHHYFIKATKEEIINYFTKNRTITNMKEQTLTRSQLLNLHNQFDCTQFRNAIEKILNNNILAKDDTKIVIEQKYIDELNQCGTKLQTNAVEAFGLKLIDDKSVDLSNFKLGYSILDVRDSNTFKNRGFHLNSDYNWSFEIDSNGSKVLVPTKK